MIPERVRHNPWLQTILLLLGAFVVLWFGYWIRDILLPFLLAFIVAYVFDPVVDWMEGKLRLYRMAAILLLCLLLVSGLTLFGIVLVNELINFVQELGKLAQDPPDILGLLPPTLREELSFYLRDIRPQRAFQRIVSFVQEHFSTLLNTLTQGTTFLWLFATRTFGVFGFIINTTIFLIVTIYLLRDFDRLISRVREIIPPDYRSQVEEMFREIDGLMRAFFRGHMIVCVIIGLLYGSGYMAIGLRGGFLVGFLSGLMNVIPYLGPAVGFLLALAMAFYQFGLSWWVLGVVGVFALVQSLEGNILTPKIVGRAVGLNPVVVIFALMVFGKLLGLLGLIVAIPLAAITKVLVGRLLRVYRSSQFYWGEAISSE